jgi:uroporphyrinogen-III synthase
VNGSMNAPRVAVTRDEPVDGPLASALRDHGLEAVACPVVFEAPPDDPEPLARAARELEQYDWVVVASARAAQALVAARGARAWPRRLHAAAVGIKTAAALRGGGASYVMTASEDGAAPLLEALRTTNAWHGVRVLVPRAADGLPTLPEGLRALGATVDEVEAYRTASPPPQATAARWGAVAAEAVVFASPSAVRALIEAVGSQAFAGITIGAIGATTAAALEAHGLSALVPPRADFDALAATLAAALGTERQPRTAS